MKNIILFIALISSSLYVSQQYRVEYRLKSTAFTDAVSETDDYLLDINKEKVAFFPKYYLKVDSLYRATKDEYKSGMMYNSRYLFFKNDPPFDLTLQYFDSNYYLIKEPKEIMKWKIQDETKVSDSMVLQKAITTFGRRNWIAWFNKEIPLPNEPYKFQGLPGLIFELYDEQQDYHFTLISIHRMPAVFSTENFFEADLGSKRITISPTQFKRMKIDYYKNPTRSGFFVGDQESNNAKKDYVIRQQKRLQSENPLELDKKPLYPKH